MTKVFVIGFNKCGTTSLHAFFRASGLSCAHWRLSRDRTLAEAMFSNLSLQRHVLEGFAGFDVYSDLNHLSDRVHLEANTLFRTIDATVPDARFILNTRDKDRWLASRSRHGSPTTGSFLARACKCYGASREEVLAIWRDQWDRHHAAVTEYFAHKPGKLLVFDIEIDPVDKLVSFFDGSFQLDPRHWGWRNRTGARAG